MTKSASLTKSVLPRHEIVENDLLGSLQTTSHHIAPYFTNIKPLPNEDSLTGDDTDCGVGASGAGPSNSNVEYEEEEDWQDEGPLTEADEERQQGTYMLAY